jgi:hypothetical protein
MGDTTDQTPCRRLRPEHLLHILISPAVVLETAGRNATEPNSYCRERALCQDQVKCWRRTASDGNTKQVLAMAEQKE